MIVCDRCKSAQFLHIDRSEIRFDDDEGLDYFLEEYVCTYCGTSGNLDSRRDPEEGLLEGTVSFTTEHPQYA